MMRRRYGLAVLALAAVLLAAGSAVVVSGQLLAYQDGYVFFTSGDGFRVASDIIIRDAKTGGNTALKPAPRIWARATFNSSGTVTELDLSRAPLPAQGSFADVQRFAVALSTPAPNPDLLAYAATPGPDETPLPTQHFSGKPVLVTFIVQVPPITPFTSSVYITTDQSGWNAQAIPMDRIDALHYQITRRYPSGTSFRYLYDRGSFQSKEVAQNGLDRRPRVFVVPDADVRVIRDNVYAWQDQANGGVNQVQPQVMPTPYNPAPFPNLPCLPPPQPPAPGHKPPPPPAGCPGAPPPGAPPPP
ncbi:MAG: hypothetical protein JO078_12425 [Candidatus Eremiobacteraeota bacterium]|nr:hypothetical protein [Candidatus Eremiobacteraeota bacterium]